MNMEKIAIFGVPRSGTTWLSQIFNSHPDVILRFQPLFSYGHKGRLSEKSTGSEIQSFFHEILHTKDNFALMTSEMQKGYPVFNKSDKPTHLVFKETRYLHIVENILTQSTDVKIIGLVRNPLATLASWVRAPREFSPAWDLTDEWRQATSKNKNRPEEFYGYEKWKEAAECFLRLRGAFPDRFALVRYHELNENPLEVTRQLFHFCGLHDSSQVDDFLKASRSIHESDPYSVYRAKANDDGWRDVLPSEIVETIYRELQNTPLSCYLQDINAV